MQIKMIYHTPAYHKLVEAIARVCYQSYGKLSPTSHTMIKGIMSKGHLSVASSGNIVFQVGMFEDVTELYDALDAMLTFKQINNFIRWTTPQHKASKSGRMMLSMNLLTLLDIVNGIDEFVVNRTLFDGIVDAIKEVPYLHWFLDNSVEIPPSDSPYIANPTMDTPVILTEDYNTLKALGLTDYELDIHATITVDLMTDRATGLQMWRHGDMAGGCELSQRYCDRSSAPLRLMVGIKEYPDALASYADAEGITMEEAREHYDAVVDSITGQLERTVDFYTDVNETLKELGVSGKRAKEIARSVLPNAVATRIIQCRPLRQWKHFISLRDTVHAQPEIYADTQALKKALDEVGVKYN